MTAVRSPEPDTAAAASAPSPRRRLSLADLGSRFGLLLAWAAVIVAFSIARPETFATAANFQTIFGSQAVLLVVTLGLLVALTAGEFDLSIAGVLNMSLVLVGYLNVVQGWPIALAVAVALGSGLIVGLVNAFFVLVIGIESIVVTLGTGTLLLGLSLGINNLSIGGISDGLVSIVREELFGIQLGFYYGLALTFLVWYVFRFTPLGRYLFFVGAGRDVARLAGIRVDMIRAGALDRPPRSPRRWAACSSRACSAPRTPTRAAATCSRRSPARSSDPRRSRPAGSTRGARSSPSTSS